LPSGRRPFSLAPDTPPVLVFALSGAPTGRNGIAQGKDQGFALGYHMTPFQGCMPPSVETGGVSALAQVDSTPPFPYHDAAFPVT
jgi:hypothetical protein